MSIYQILEFVEKKKKWMTAREIGECLDAGPSIISGGLKKLRKSGMISSKLKMNKLKSGAKLVYYYRKK